MRKWITIAYEACVCLAAAFLAYLFCTARNELFTTDEAGSYELLKNHKWTQMLDDTAPLGFAQVYTFTKDEVPAGSNALVFRSIHQNVSVYIEGALVFRLRKDLGSSPGKSPGCRWNTIPINVDQQGKEIRVEIQPVYQSVTDIVPYFYAGTRAAIYMRIVKEDLSAILLGFLAVVLGVGFMLFTALNRHNPKFDKSLFMLGQFSFFIGIWKLMDTRLSEVLAQHEGIISNVAFLALMLLVVPFIQYFRELFVLKDHWIWNAACLASILVFIVSLGAQMAGIADFKETLWMNHLILLLAVLIMFPLFFMEVKKSGWSHKLKAVGVSIGACYIGFAADIIVYYWSDGVYVTDLGIAGFLVYIMIHGTISLLDARRLMTIGLKAEQYERMAYLDQLTGLPNRAAYAQDTVCSEFVKQDSLIVMFDLNNLKHCNDTYGHEKGDLYIKSGARLIKQVFGPYGKCYRMGGDEFCAVLSRKTELECEKLIQNLKNRAKEWDQVHKEDFLIQIAAGYAAYNSMVDFDVGDTLRRADKMMYRDKFEMKQGRTA